MATLNGYIKVWKYDYIIFYFPDLPNGRHIVGGRYVLSAPSIVVSDDLLAELRSTTLVKRGVGERGKEKNQPLHEVA